ncbi:MAG: hypothetical protein ACN6QY_04470 [Pseudomonas sp.]|uniref:hypothetical protein n=1 Tax=Pseudomonas sp. TaxID=306 RepID=UPI003D10B4CC
MKFTSAGKRVEPSTVGYRSLGFGETSILETTPYTLEIDHDELPARFLECADGFISECRIDDKAQGYADIAPLQQLDYPGFRQLLKNEPDLAASLIRDYLYFELFFYLFASISGLEIVINDIASVHVTGTAVIITGQTFRARHT